MCNFQDRMGMMDKTVKLDQLEIQVIQVYRDLLVKKENKEIKVQLERTVRMEKMEKMVQVDNKVLQEKGEIREMKVLVDRLDLLGKPDLKETLELLVQQVM